MANADWEMEIPSSSSGEIYSITGYDDGSTICTCRNGSFKGLGCVDICICNRCAGPFHVIPSAGKH